MTGQISRRPAEECAALIVNCNLNTPGWGASLGTITWGNTTNTDIEYGTSIVATSGGGRPSQVWSGAVFASACNKGNATSGNAFDGGDMATADFNADCRQTLHSFHDRASSQTGDFFSWCAVIRFGHILCPDGWRVPDSADFANLHQNLGFALPLALIDHTTSGIFIPTDAQGGNDLAFPAQVGGIWGGARFIGMAMQMDFPSAYYWSSTEANATFARAMFITIGAAAPESVAGKLDGFAVRCVRDTVLPVLSNNCNLNTPGWGGSLGTITWGSTTNTNIDSNINIILGTGGRPNQAWSGAVFATACAKGDATVSTATFDGGGGGVGGASFNADCRQSLHTFTAGRANGITGDFFSWCAVYRFADELCPGGWRVPTLDDFANLILNFGFGFTPLPGTSHAHGNDGRYIPTDVTATTANPQVGGTWGGARFTGNTESNLTVAASFYWSSTEVSVGSSNARFLRLDNSVGFGLSGGKQVGLALRCVRDTVLEQPMTGCNNLAPGWGSGPLGASFVSTQEWTIAGTGGRPSQIWSDAVGAAACATRTTQFNGGGTNDWNADCRNTAGNAAFDGHLFSWCAVMRFANELCPAPWRVPTREDFVNLDMNLGGTGNTRSGGATELEVDAWYAGPATIWGGARWTGNATNVMAGGSVYWSSTENSTLVNEAFPFQFNNNMILPQGGSTKGTGMALRCVRDTVVTMPQGCNDNSLGFVLGIPAFATDSVWIITGTEGRTSQVWSDAVTAPGCANRTTFNGGNEVGNMNADCRNSAGNANFGGHLFSWCMVTRFADQLCPGGWRVPTRQDFIDLDLNLGGDGNSRPAAGENTPMGIVTLGYVGTNAANSPASTWGGSRWTEWAPFGQMLPQSFYWSQTRSVNPVSGSAYTLFFSPTNVNPHHLDGKGLGAALRCVRDTVLPPRLVSKNVLPGDTICNPFPGGNLTISATFTGYGTNPTVQWSIAGGANIAGANSKDLVLTTAPTTTTTYRITVTNNQTGLTAFYDKTVVVVPGHTLTRTSAVATENQSIGVNSPITNIVYARGGSATAVTITWTGTADSTTAPAGINITSLTATPITISGTPSQVGIFTFTITTVENRCAPVSQTGSITVGMRGCNPAHPNWLASMGTITWGNTSNQDIESGTSTIASTGGGRPSQTWSAPVFATSCAKGNASNNNAFIGGTTAPLNLNADCRQTYHTFNNGRAAGITGDLFSWCAVIAFADELCPAPWRVPTQQDFHNLYQNLGFTIPAGTFVGTPHNNAGHFMPTSGTALAPEVGGRWGGVRFSGFAAGLQLTQTQYWSTTESTADRAFIYGFDATNVWTRATDSKFAGVGVRCVRDTVIPPPSGCNPNHPNWLPNVGTVTWGNRTNSNIESNATTILGTGGRSAQAWSAHVFASACNKGTITNGNAFVGGTAGNLNADCRRSLHSAQNGGNLAAHITGDLFSWCAVMTFANNLCPYPWRVPSAEDFRNLHLNLGFVDTLTIGIGGGGMVSINANALRERYMNPTTGTPQAPTIGGRWGGVRFTGHANTLTQEWSNYWLSTEYSGTPTTQAHQVVITTANVSLPQASKQLGFALRCVRDTVIPPLPMTGCNPNHPNWLPSIGTVTWGNRSNSNIEVNTTPITGTGGRLSQVWSGHVFASVCNKGGTAVTINDFNGGTTPGNFNADCRRSFHSANNAANPAVHINGDLFSWCAVMEFAEQLCPAPWRVPTEQDFRDLHLNLGWATVPSPGIAAALNTDALRGRYMNPTTGTAADPTIGGTWGGSRFTANTHAIAATQSLYWSSTEYSTTGVAARMLGLTDGHVWPVMNSYKDEGAALRCVRN